MAQEATSPTASPCDASQPSSQGRRCSAIRPATLGGEGHLEAVVADPPAHRVGRCRASGPSRWPTSRQASGLVGGLGPADHGRRAVGEQGVGRRPGRGRARTGSGGCTARPRRAGRGPTGRSPAKAPATRRPFRAPWQPMKPTCVRWTPGSSPRPVEQGQVEPRRREPGAGDRDQVRDLDRRDPGRRQRPAGGLAGQRPDRLLVVLHPARESRRRASRRARGHVEVVEERDVPLADARPSVEGRRAGGTGPRRGPRPCWSARRPVPA